MELVYNIDFEVAGAIYLLIMYGALEVYYSDRSEVNKRFKLFIVSLLIAEIMDIITAVTISYGL